MNDVPSSAPAPIPVTFETDRHYKVHHSYIWLSPLAITFSVFFLAVIGNINDIMKGYRALQDMGYSGTGFVILSIVGILLIVYAIIVALHAIAYRFLSFEFGAREFSLYSGFITKKHVHVPYERVQSVNHRATIIQRLFGLCSVSIDTAGGASNKAVRVPYVRLETGERIRTELFARKLASSTGAQTFYVPASSADNPIPAGAPVAGAPVNDAYGQAVPAGMRQTAPANFGQAIPAASPNTLENVAGDLGRIRGAFGGMEPGMEPVSYELGLANNELFLTGASHASSSAIGFVMGLIGLITGATVSMQEHIISGVLGLGILGGIVTITIIALIFGWIIGIAKVCISFGGFRARRRGSRIEVERGLLQREYSGIDISRVQSVEIRQSFIRRCMGYCEISLGRIDVAEGQNSQQNSSKLDRNGLIIHPFIKVDRVDEVLHGLLPEFDAHPQVPEPLSLPRVSLRRAITRKCIWRNWWFWTSIVVAAFEIILHATVASRASYISSEDAAIITTVDGTCIIVYAILALTFIFSIVSAVLWYRGSGFSLNEGYALIRNDGLGTSCSVIPRTKIQYGYTRTNPFQRHSQVSAITAVTAAGTGHTAVRLWDVRVEEAQMWLDWLLPRRQGD